MKRLLTAALAASMLAPAAISAATLPRTMLTITSAISVDTANHTATLPIHKQLLGKTTAWYIITDASTAAAARKLGVNYASSLGAITALRTAAPNFSPTRSYVPSASGFPPKSATPGGTSPRGYTPFIRSNGAILNASVIATGNGPFDVVHHTNTEDRVIAIDTKKMTATLVLAQGFFEGKHVYYLSTEASAAVPAAVERATFEPGLDKLGAAVPIGVIANGPQAGKNPQGLAYLSLHTPLGNDATIANAKTIGSPFNLLSAAPKPGSLFAESGYTPLWSASVDGVKQTKRLTSFAQIAAMAKPAGFVVNCPIVAYGDESSY